MRLSSGGCGWSRGNGQELISEAGRKRAGEAGGKPERGVMEAEGHGPLY